ncbi:MAG TPA: hypothetical protein VFZ99_01495 [Terriglobales bacterium]
MRKTTFFQLAALAGALLFSGALAAQEPPSTSATPASASRGSAASPVAPGLLSMGELKKVLPATVFFRGQSAPVQLRNAGGIRFQDGRLLLAALVDNSGYSTRVAAKYQGYLIVEDKIKVGDQELAPGAYGFGFVAQDQLVVQDIGAHDVLTTTFQTDSQLPRPTPLRIAQTGGEYRLYSGRKYVTITAPAAP